MEKELAQLVAEVGVIGAMVVAFLAMIYLLSKGLTFLMNRSKDTAVTVSALGTVARVFESYQEEKADHQKQNERITETQETISKQLETSATIQHTMLGLIGSLQTAFGNMKQSIGLIEQDIVIMKDDASKLPEVIESLSEQMKTAIETLNLLHIAHGEHDSQSAQHKTDIVSAIERLQSMLGTFMETLAVPIDAEGKDTKQTSIILEKENRGEQTHDDKTTPKE